MPDYYNQEELSTIPFDEKLQLIIANLCLKNSGFLFSCQKHLKGRYFDNSHLGWIFDFISKFYFQYHHIPNLTTIRNELLKFSPDERVAYEIILKKILEVNFEDIGYLKKELTVWTKKKFLYDNMHLFAEMFRNNKADEAYNFMQDFANKLLHISYDETDLFDFDKIDEILEYAKHSFKYKLKLGIPPIDEELLGGISRQNVCLFIGPMHSGKSIILGNLARKFVSQGKKVLFFDLENDLRKLVIRMFSYFCQIPYNKFWLTSGLNEDELKKVNKTKEILKSNLFLKSVTDFNVYIEKMILEIKQKYLENMFDVVIIDYAQIIKTKGFSKTSKYEYLQEIMRGLSCVARELDIAIVTAAQINKEGQKKAMKSKGKDTVDLIDIAESFGITRVVDPIITITKSEEDDKKNQIRFKLAKNRDGKVNQVIACEADFQHCRIFDDDLMCKIVNEETDDEYQIDNDLVDIF